MPFPHPNPNARTRAVQFQRGSSVGLVSGGFDLCVKPIAPGCQVDVLPLEYSDTAADSAANRDHFCPAVPVLAEPRQKLPLAGDSHRSGEAQESTVEVNTNRAVIGTLAAAGQFQFSNTEQQSAYQSPAVGKRVVAPKGLGRPGNKPLMRNLTGLCVALPDGNTAGDNFLHLQGTIGGDMSKKTNAKLRLIIHPTWCTQLAAVPVRIQHIKRRWRRIERN